MKFININQKGDSEAFESFRMLIAFILASAILIIIINMVNNVNEKSIQISNQKLSEGIISGVKSVGTSARVPFVISDLLLRGQLDRRTVQNLSGLNKDCVSFVAGPGVTKSDNGEFITIKGNYRKMDVYVYCNQTAHNGLNVVNSFYPEVYTDLTRNGNNPFDICPTFCVFFFNKKPVNDIYNN